jgi:hypothetical protein
LVRCPAKGPMGRPLMAASIATSSGTMGALDLRCTNLWSYCLRDSPYCCLHWKRSNDVSAPLAKP